MRIGVCYANSSSPDPCATFIYGEWEDYLLEITGETVIFDASTISIDMDTLLPAGLVSPKATVKNKGLETISFPVTCTIDDYSSTKEVTNLSAGEEIMVEFDPWLAVSGTYTVNVCTQLLNDEISENDCISLDVSTLTYDVGISNINIAPAIQPGEMIPKATVKNFGFETVSFPVTMTIEGTEYTSTAEVVNLAPGDEIVTSFDTWNSTSGSSYHVVVCSELTLDENSANNCQEMDVVVEENVRQNVILEIATGTW
jgi:LEA14-like dessication related protein